jgi:hypothetical protein
VNVSLDGTGTPWQEDLVNDWFGFFQSLLDEAGITPDESPDEVGASQYLEALLLMITSRTDPLAAVWTDLAAVTNFFHNFTDTDIGAQASSGRAIIWNPITKRFYSINRNDSNNPTGLSFQAPYVDITTTLTMDAGDGLTVHPFAALCDPAGKMVVGGAPAASSQSRYRSSTGGSWTARTSAKAASTVGPTSGVYAAGTINKFFMGYTSGGEIESSSDGETWANALAAGLQANVSMAFSPTLNMIITVGGGTEYRTSLDGAAWTERAAPANFQVVSWSVGLSAFIAVSDADTWYTSSDGIAWALAAGTTVGDTTKALIHEYQGVITTHFDGQFFYSADGLATWAQEVSTVSPTGGSTFALSSAIDPERGTLMLGNYIDGFHMVTGRFGP